MKEKGKFAVITCQRNTVKYQRCLFIGKKIILPQQQKRLFLPYKRTLFLQHKAYSKITVSYVPLLCFNRDTRSIKSERGFFNEKIFIVFSGVDSCYIIFGAARANDFIRSKYLACVSCFYTIYKS